MAASRSLGKGQEPWQTFSVNVRVVRGRAEVYAEVALSSVTGIVGSTLCRPRPVWQGVIARREPQQHVTPEAAAVWAQGALERAFPTLF